nr:hypothetical protein [uncultured Undibacterium sp.]
MNQPTLTALRTRTEQPRRRLGGMWKSTFFEFVITFVLCTFAALAIGLSASALLMSSESEGSAPAQQADVVRVFSFTKFDPSALKTTLSEIALHGVIVASDPTKSIAVLAINNKHPKMFALSDRIEGDISITAISLFQIVLSDGRRIGMSPSTLPMQEFAHVIPVVLQSNHAEKARLITSTQTDEGPIE